MLALKRTQDRKTANLSNAAGTQSVIANAFSLPSGTDFSCPGATSICEKICYAGRLEKMYKGFRGVVMHNFDLLKDADIDNMVTMLSSMVQSFENDCDKRGVDKLFRIHADGDFFSLDYAKAWAEVIKIHSDVHFWVYTRSFTDKLNVIPVLANLDNLSVYLSCDAENMNAAQKIMKRYPYVKVAMLAETFAEARTALATMTDRRAPACPELKKSIDLIDKNGGACVNCGLCVFNRNSVLFSTTKR